jgi:hypothetical protein
MALEVMKIDNGFWAILTMRQSGKETGRINMGQYIYYNELKELIDALKNGR